MKKFRNLELIISGLPRSGTSTVHNILIDQGLKSGHEKHFPPVGLSMFHEEKTIYEVSWCAAPHFKHLKEYYPGTKLIQLVRDPLKVISSQRYTNGEQGYFSDVPNCEQVPYRYMKQHLPALMTDNKISELDKYIIFYYEWNKMMAPYCDGIFSIEEITKDPRAFLKACGIGDGPEIKIDTKRNTSGVKEYLTLGDFQDCRYVDLLRSVLY